MRSRRFFEPVLPPGDGLAGPARRWLGAPYAALCGAGSARQRRRPSVRDRRASARLHWPISGVGRRDSGAPPRCLRSVSVDLPAPVAGSRRAAPVLAPIAWGPLPHGIRTGRNQGAHLPVILCVRSDGRAGRWSQVGRGGVTLHVAVDEARREAGGGVFTAIGVVIMGLGAVWVTGEIGSDARSTSGLKSGRNLSTCAWPPGPARASHPLRTLDVPMTGDGAWLMQRGSSGPRPPGTRRRGATGLRPVAITATPSRCPSGSRRWASPSTRPTAILERADPGSG